MTSTQPRVARLMFSRGLTVFHWIALGPSRPSSTRIIESAARPDDGVKPMQRYPGLIFPLLLALAPPRTHGDIAETA